MLFKISPAHGLFYHLSKFFFVCVSSDLNHVSQLFVWLKIYSSQLWRLLYFNTHKMYVQRAYSYLSMVCYCTLSPTAKAYVTLLINTLTALHGQ